MHIIQQKKITRKNMLVPEISPHNLKFALAGYASLNSWHVINSFSLETVHI